VDGVGTIRSRHQDSNALYLTIEAPPELLHYCVPKGSITIDGISMTLNEVTEKTFTLCVIPHTAKITTLSLKQVGDSVNLESDLIGKYVERLLRSRGQLPQKPSPVIDVDYLKRKGLL
jgi:riboflavin synthase